MKDHIPLLCTAIGFVWCYWLDPKTWWGAIGIGLVAAVGTVVMAKDFGWI